jgi:RNA polymerase sigma-70 factor (ECF subfamily)
MLHQTRSTTSLLRQLGGGDEQAPNLLVAHACDRLLLLTRKMLRGYPAVRRWEQTGDVAQNASIRLRKALEAVRPKSRQHFWNLAGLQIRRELIDLARHHLGPQGQGARHHTDCPGAADDPGGPLWERADDTGGPASLADWARFHEEVELLPEEEREVVNLLWYQGKSQEEAAALLSISLRTLKRRWQSTRRRLARALRG